MTSPGTSVAITARLLRQSELADLRTAARLAHKVDMSAAAVTRRLRRQADLLRACRRWRAGRSPPRPAP